MRGRDGPYGKLRAGSRDSTMRRYKGIKTYGNCN
jgi:hypothetical protein